MVKKKLNIAFVHPDLGIGGAERLVCDAALALQKQGHGVKLFTSHHDPSHCFKETSDGTLSVVAIGDWLPRHTFKRLFAFWAYVRTIYVALYLAFVSHYSADVIFCDQVSACIPFLRFCKKAQILFYCHFPDMLLTQRKSFLKKIYRFPLDWLEEYTTGLADIILVNSQFTAQIFSQTFTSLSGVKPVVLYPSLNFTAFEKSISKEARDQILHDRIPNGRSYRFLSINRYERKKNLGLAINALKVLKDTCSTEQWNKVHLIMAGGYDERVEENKEYHLELEKLALRLCVRDHVTFLRSFTDDEKIVLLQQATCLLYTPSNEHFGIVPIEAMFMKCPVIACKSGGPLETVKNQETGFLCEPSAEAFGIKMFQFLQENTLRDQLGDNGHKRVKNNFSFDAFTNNLDIMVNQMVEETSSRKSAFSFWALICLFCLSLVFIILNFINCVF